MDKQHAMMMAIEDRVREGNFRKDVLQLLDDDCDAVLEFGYGDGTLLFAAKLLKGARRIYGIDVAQAEASALFDGAWHLDLSNEASELGEEWAEAFDCILSCCVIEHVYDPWAVLSKLRRYLKKDGRIIFEVPNIQCWESLYRIAVGEFPYTSGAHFDSTHIRWYTVHSFAEILEFVGYELESVLPLTFGADLSFLQHVNELRTITLPPPGVNSDAPPIIMKFPVDMKSMYPFFVAPRFIFTARRGAAPLRDRKAGYHDEFEAFRLQHASRCRLMEKIIADPVNAAVARRLSEKLKVSVRHIL